MRAVPCDGAAVRTGRCETPGVRFAKVDVDAEPALAARFEVRSIPTLVVLRDGEPVAAEAGVVGVDQLVEALDRIAAPPARVAATKQGVPA
ncbi:MAG TPA: thioredoxin family protein [Solirubrobacteraceae bacterium]|nr:thioredoxin family protein [Solirubrobacteraceae bacterium]